MCKHVFLHMFKWDHNDNIGHRPPPFSFHMGDCTHFHKVHQFNFLFEKLSICCTYHCHYVFFELSLVLIGGIISNSFHMFFFSPFKVGIRVPSLNVVAYIPLSCSLQKKRNRLVSKNHLRIT